MGDILNAALGSYEAAVRGCCTAGVPPELRATIHNAIQLACLYAQPGCAARPRRGCAVRLLGSIAAVAPKEFMSLISQDAEATACVAQLVNFGVTCPSAAVRKSATALVELNLPPPVTS